MEKDLTSFVRGTIVAFMATTAVFMLLSGVGTTCLAWNAANMGGANANLAEYSLFYKTAVFLYLIIGFIASITTYAFIRGEKWAYWVSVVALSIGAIYSVAHVLLSQSLRGASLPNDVRMIVTIATLIVLALVRLPWIWNRIDLTRKPEGEGSYSIPTGMAFVIGGLSVLLVPMMSLSSHIIEGVNYVAILQPQLNIIGGVMIAVGTGLLALIKLGFNPDAWIIAIYNRLSSNSEVKGVK